jgi:ABC-type Co2+ transport system permease subunit
MFWLRARLLEWRKRPLLAVVAASFLVVWALRIPAQDGSKWDSILASAAWFLLVGTVVVALVDGRRSNRSE